MNPPKILDDSSLEQQSNPAIETLQSSVHNLVKSWHRRQQWKLLFNPADDEQGQNKRAPWRNNLIKFLESTKIRAVAVSLLLVDLILTILELSFSLLSCTPEKKNYKIERLWFHWVGIAILSLLSAKAIALAVGLGSSLFRRPGYVVDGAVVIGALILEALLEKKGGGLLVVVSLWRVVRVVESAFELSDEAIEAQIDGILCQFELVREENTRLLEMIAEKDMVINKLQEIIETLQQVMKCDQCRQL